MPTSPAAVGRAVTTRDASRYEARRLRAHGAGAGPGLFSHERRVALFVWGCVSLPVVAVAACFATTPGRYLVIFAVVASGFYTTPALVNTWLAARRAPAGDALAFWLWTGAIVTMYGIGCAMIAGVVTGMHAPTAVALAAVATVSLLLMTSIVVMVRGRSGARAISVDLIESAMSVIVIVAPLGLLWGESVLRSETHWYAVPASLAVPCMVFGVYWAVLLYIRLVDRCAIGTIGVALAVVGLANAVLQTAQGVTGFALPAVPLLVLHGLCMSLVGFIPLYVPDRISAGLDRLPPQNQVRGAWLPAALMLAGLPILLATTVAVRDRYAWAPYYSLAVAGVLLLLASLRQLAAVRETRRLYGQIQRAAETRRQLLAQVVQRTDDDRHRVAAQLHEQAVSAYATFVSFMQNGALAPPAAGRPLAGASAIVRDELGKQAESLRRLMLAVQPLQVDRSGSRSLDTPIRAYVDGLYGDRRAPVQEVAIGDDLVLDWATETVVLRIIQEAVNNVWRHSQASRLAVTIGADAGGIVIEVADDGVGFDPAGTLFESGIAVMRSLAGLGDGEVAVDSAPGRGTRIRACLGGPLPAPDPVPDPAPSGPPRLRLVTGTGEPDGRDAPPTRDAGVSVGEA